jgi:hypothetical protein
VGVAWAQHGSNAPLLPPGHPAIHQNSASTGRSNQCLRAASAVVSTAATAEDTSAKKSRDKGSTRNANAICCLMTVNQRQTDGSERQFKAVKRRGGLGRLVTRHQDLFLLIKGRPAGLTCCLSPDSLQCIIIGGAAEGMHIRSTLSRRQRGDPALLGTEIRRCSSHLRHLIGMISCTTMRGKVLGGASE